MIRPTNGMIKIFGKDIRKDFNLWNEIGYIVEAPHAYPNLSVRENLEIFVHLRKLSDKKSIDFIIDQLKLKDY